MSEPSVADVLEWEALEESTRERYRSILRDELYAEIRYEVRADLEQEDEDKLDTARDVLREAEVALKKVIKESENALIVVSGAWL